MLAPFPSPTTGERPVLGHIHEGFQDRAESVSAILSDWATHDIPARFGDRGILMGLPDKIQDPQLNLNFR